MCDTSSYRNFVRMDSATFEELPTSIAPRITFRDTVLRQAISLAERLAMTTIPRHRYILYNMCIY